MAQRSLAPERALEGLAAPARVREFVLDRDGHCCRVCGAYVEVPHLHHIVLRSQGGLNSVENLITLDGDCHLYVVHKNTRLWTPVLQQCVKTPGVTARQLMRWQERMSRHRTIAEVHEDFWSLVEVMPSGCWEWGAGRRHTEDGYGELKVASLSPYPIKSHRLAFYLLHGRWPLPACLHSCDNPACVKRELLREGTQQDNMRDRRERRPRFGVDNPAARLTTAQVASIRQQLASVRVAPRWRSSMEEWSRPVDRCVMRLERHLLIRRVVRRVCR